jgi:hypothetical protein
MMTNSLLASSVAKPAFIYQYGPLLAALVALSGVLVTLIVNVRRDRIRYRNEREDNYRHDQRNAIAAIVVAGHGFRRECASLVDFDQWQARREAADTAMAGLLNELTVAKLLVHDISLQGALDGVFKAWDVVCEAVDKLEIARVGEKAARGEAVESLEDSLREFDQQSNILHSVTLKTLKPTIVKDG